MFKNFTEARLKSVLFLAILFIINGVLTLPVKATSTLAGPFNSIKSYSLTRNGFAYTYEDPNNSNKVYVVINGTQYGSYYGLSKVNLFDDGRWSFVYNDGDNPFLLADGATYQLSKTVDYNASDRENDSYAFVLATGCVGYATNVCTVLYKKPGQAPEQATLGSLGLEDGYYVNKITIGQHGLIFAAVKTDDYNNGLNNYFFTNIEGVAAKFGPYHYTSGGMNFVVTTNHYAFVYKKDNTPDYYVNYDGQEFGPYGNDGSLNEVGDTIIYISNMYSESAKSLVNGVLFDNKKCFPSQNYSWVNNSFFDYYICQDSAWSNDINEKFYFAGVWDGLVAGVDDYETDVYSHLFRAKFNKKAIYTDINYTFSYGNYYKDGNCVQTKTTNAYGSNGDIKVNGVVQDSSVLVNFEGSSIKPSITDNSWAYVYQKNNKFYVRYGLNETNPTGAGCDYTINTCGNGAIDSGEVCDGTNLNGQTCLTKGFSGGTLSCASTCQSFVTSACTSTSSNTCSDSDGGVYVNVFGTATLKDSGGNILDTKYDTCAGSSIIEYYCQSNQILSSASTCLHGCSNGACVQQTTTTNTCTDSDGGIEYTKYGTATLKDSSGNILETKYDVCSGSVLTEYYCQSNQILNISNNCAYGCLNGACKQSTSIAPTCTDTDEKNIYNKGSVAGKDLSGSSYTTYDECSGSGAQVNEMWCYDLNGGKVPGKMVFDCANGCSSGACKQKTTIIEDKTVVEKNNEIIDLVTAKATMANNELILKLNRLLSDLEQKVTDLEKRLTTTINKVLTAKLKGQILIQPEANGEVWYTSPDTGERFYVANGQAAYGILSGMGKGITNANLKKVPIGYDPNLYGGLTDTDDDGLPDVLEQAIGTDINKADTDGDGYNDLAEASGGYNPNGTGSMPINKAFAKNLKGIYLDINNKGAAWYINPKDSKRYYISPETAYNVMKYLSLGITNSNLRTIPVGEVTE